MYKIAWEGKVKGKVSSSPKQKEEGVRENYSSIFQYNNVNRKRRGGKKESSG